MKVPASVASFWAKRLLLEGPHHFLELLKQHAGSAVGFMSKYVPLHWLRFHHTLIGEKLMETQLVSVALLTGWFPRRPPGGAVVESVAGLTERLEMT